MDGAEKRFLRFEVNTVLERASRRRIRDLANHYKVINFAYSQGRFLALPYGCTSRLTIPTLTLRGNAEKLSRCLYTIIYCDVTDRSITIVSHRNNKSHLLLVCVVGI